MIIKEKLTIGENNDKNSKWKVPYVSTSKSSIQGGTKCRVLKK